MAEGEESLSAGTASLPVHPDLTGFGAKLKAGVEGEAAGVGSSLKKTGEKIAGLMGVGFAAGEVFKLGFDKLKSESGITAQLNAALTSTKGASGENIAGLDKLAEHIQNYSGQTDESVKAAEAQLLAFTNVKNAAGANNDVFDRTIALSADMAARMGTDSAGAAKTLGRALSDPEHGMARLARSGVVFTDSQKAQIKAMQDSGDTMGAQKLMLDALTEKYGGAAKAAGDSLPGQLNKAKNMFVDLSAKIVTVVLPVILKITEGVTKFGTVAGPWFDAHVMPVVKRLGQILTNDVYPIFVKLFRYVDDHKTLFQSIAVGVGVLVAAWIAYQTTMTVVGAITKAYTAIQAALNVVMDANPIMLVVLAIAALAAGLVYAYKHSETFRDIVQAVFRDVSGAAIAVKDALVHAFDNVVHAFDNVKQAAVDTVDWVRAKWDGLVSFFTGLPGKLSSLFSGIWHGVTAGLKDAVNFVLHLPLKIPEIKLGAFGHYVNVGGQTLIPSLAHGGVVMPQPGGQLVNVAEAGKPEAIVPLGQNGGFDDLVKEIRLLRKDLSKMAMQSARAFGDQLQNTAGQAKLRTLGMPAR